MRGTRHNWWLTLNTPIIGYDDGQNTPGTGDGNANSGDGQGASGEGAGGTGTEGQGAGSTGDEGQGASDDTAGLKSALQKERDGRKAMEKELARYKKAEQDKADADKSEVDRATTQAQRAEEKAAKLAVGFKDSAVRSAILSAAGKAKFLDPSDALRPEVIAAIGVEQDEDDPTNVTIDEATVTAAVKKLATEKKHYIGTGNGQTQQQKPPKSGSSFGGNNNQGQGDPEKAALLAKYPALRGRIG
jgi:hypothetical protein